MPTPWVYEASDGVLVAYNAPVSGLLRLDRDAAQAVSRGPADCARRADSHLARMVREFGHRRSAALARAANPASTMGNLVVGNFDYQNDEVRGNGFIYNTATHTYTTVNIGHFSTMIYGVWQNGAASGTLYTIVGGFAMMNNVNGTITTGDTVINNNVMGIYPLGTADAASYISAVTLL
jgi:hypothetical protein